VNCSNLGRFTDKAAKIILLRAFGLSPDVLLKKVSIAANNRTEVEETDGVILANEVRRDDAKRVQDITNRLAGQLAKPFAAQGVGFEFRGRYGKNDDTLLQKDEHMADAIRHIGAVPVLGMFSTSNAAGAMLRLRRSWVIVQGRETVSLLAELTGFDLIEYLHSRHKMLAPAIDLIKKS